MVLKLLIGHNGTNNAHYFVARSGPLRNGHKRIMERTNNHDLLEEKLKPKIVVSAFQIVTNLERM